MSKKIYGLSLVVFMGFLVQSNLCADINDVQFTKTLSIIRNTCQSKLQITNDQIETIKKHIGTLEDDSQEKCYATCILEMFNFVIDGKIPTDLAHTTIGAFMPDDIKHLAQNALETCRSNLDPADAGNIHCVIGYSMLHCLTENSLKFLFV